MLDYDLKLESMDEKAIDQEISRITDLLFRHNPESSTYQQLLVMYEMAQVRQQEIQMLANAPQDKTIDLGDIDESVYYPDYTRAELLDAVVTQYHTGDKHES
jgi:hypothetical protein